MGETRKTLIRVLIYYLLFAISIVFSSGFIADYFPTRNLATIYFLTLSLCLILYYSNRVIPKTKISIFMRLLSWMGLLLIFLRGLKYSAFTNIDIIARHLWYSYYVPIILAPLFLFYVALYVSRNEKVRLPIYWHLVSLISLVLIVLVLTNDLHQQAFIFKPDFLDWDSDYTYSWLFYAINAWQILLFLAAASILTVKCRISNSKKSVWLLAIPVLVGAALYALLLTDSMPKIGNSSIINFPETHILTVTVVLEICIQLGLIPTNGEYRKIFNHLSLRAQVTDKKGNAVYVSSLASPLKEGQFSLPSGSRIEGHVVLNKMELTGGYGFWVEDMSKLDAINEELEETKEGLKQEAEITRLLNDLKEKKTKVEERTLLYDRIASCTQPYSEKIRRLALEAKRSGDLGEKDRYRRHIALLGSYIKRYANLILLSEESERIEMGELSLSIAEVFKYLNYCFVPAELVGSGPSLIDSSCALAAFECLINLIEANLESAKGVFAYLSSGEETIMKIVIENLESALSEEEIGALLEADVSYSIKIEDDIAYIALRKRKEGEQR